MEQAPLFIADVHLGKLARLLRLLGFDVLYSNESKPEALTAQALAEGRVLLSKNAAFRRISGLHFFKIESSDSEEQLAEVLNHFGLKSFIQPFTRCLYCNEPLISRSKEEVLERLPPNTRKYYDAFWECPCCERVYWQGPHYERMVRLVAGISQ